MKKENTQIINLLTSSLSYMTGLDENGDGSCLNIGHVSQRLSGELSPDKASSKTGPDTACTENTILKQDTGIIRYDVNTRHTRQKYK